MTEFLTIRLLSTGVELHNVSLDTFSLKKYYKSDSKTLDLSNLPLGDESFSRVFEHIKHFSLQNEVRNLSLENIDLETIPYNVIIFALLDKNLRYVSLKGNKFNLPIRHTGESGLNEVRLTIEELHRYTGMRKYSDPVRMKQELELAHPESSHEALAFVSSFLSSMWSHIAPELDVAIEQTNISSDRACYFCKIIEIDDNLPPITIIDSTKLPRTRLQLAKSLGKKALLVLLGAVVSLSPQIITLATSSSCDCDELNQLLLACNITGD